MVSCQPKNYPIRGSRVSGDGRVLLTATTATELLLRDRDPERGSRLERGHEALPINSGQTAGPTFEVYRFKGEPWAETLDMARTVVDGHAALAPVEKALKATLAS